MMMIRIPQALAAVIAGTLASGAAGGIVGATVGTVAPGFVAWLQWSGHGGPGLLTSPAEFGLGLGTVCGLLLGAGSSVVMVLGLAFRDAWLLRADLTLGRKPTRWRSFERILD